MHSFSDKTRFILEASGWFDGRTFNTDAYEAMFLEKQVAINQPALDFWGEFGGLHIQSPHPKDTSATMDINFDVLSGFSNYEAWNFLDILEGLEIEACPIGWAYDRYIMLFMDADGRVYGDYVEGFFFGNSPDEALDALCEGRSVECVRSTGN